jgi:predicted kinase
MATLTLIRGLPGSGKSTLAKRLASQTCMDRHFEADMYFLNENGEYCFDPKKLPDAHAWCREMVFEALLEGRNVYVSNTFTTKQELQPYIDIAKSLHIIPNIILMQGQFESIHGVPEYAIARMRERFEYDI